jgi:hypothetical protein
MRSAKTFVHLISSWIVVLALRAPSQAVEARPQLNRVRDIATNLAACWRPPHEDDQVTVRISFTRDGAVIGEPRIAYVRSGGKPADDGALADSMMEAIRDCTPLHFSTRLGSAIAGRVLAIRFIGPSQASIIDQP